MHELHLGNHVPNKITPERPKSARVPYSQFQALQNGMTYDQVRAILGCDGLIRSTQTLGNSELVHYDWKGNGSRDATVTVIFIDKALYNKSWFN